jgi:hypothetical protein
VQLFVFVVTILQWKVGRNMAVLQQLLQPLWEIFSEPIAVTGNEQNPDGPSILYINQA